MIITEKRSWITRSYHFYIFNINPWLSIVWIFLSFVQCNKSYNFVKVLFHIQYPYFNCILFLNHVYSNEKFKCVFLERISTTTHIISIDTKQKYRPFHSIIIIKNFESLFPLHIYIYMNNIPIYRNINK